MHNILKVRTWYSALTVLTYLFQLLVRRHLFSALGPAAQTDLFRYFAKGFRKFVLRQCLFPRLHILSQVTIVALEAWDELLVRGYNCHQRPGVILSKYIFQDSPRSAVLTAKNVNDVALIVHGHKRYFTVVRFLFILVVQGYDGRFLLLDCCSRRLNMNLFVIL